MKGTNGSSYKPYRTMLDVGGDIYISRLVPPETTIHVEWLGEGENCYEVFYRARGEEHFILSGKCYGTEFEITDLTPDTDYELYISSGEKISRVRLARCGKSIGTVVNYLHPDDEAFAYSGRYLCSPSLLCHPDGYLLASMDVYHGDGGQNLTLIFRSDDNGESWHYVCDLFPCFWGKLFLHQGDVYMLGCSTEYGDLLIGKSEDGGMSFGAPTVLLRGTGGFGGFSDFGDIFGDIFGGFGGGRTRRQTKVKGDDITVELSAHEKSLDAVDQAANRIKKIFGDDIVIIK